MKHRNHHGACARCYFARVLRALRRADHGALAKRLSELLSGLITSEDVDIDVARGLYWFASDWYDGQWSGLYALLCITKYSPGAGEVGVEEGMLDDAIYGAMLGIETEACA